MRSERAKAWTVLTMNTVAFTVCFAVWMMNGVLVTFLVDGKVFAFDKVELGWLIGLPVLTGSLLRLPVGILTDRSPLLVKLGIGPLRVDVAGGQSRYFFIEGGVAQMKDNTLTILTTVATPADALDAQAAAAELAEATARHIPDAAAFEDRQRGMARARAKRELAGRRR